MSANTQMRGGEPPPRPVYRRLRGYAFDPSLSVQLDTAVINETVYKVEWEGKSASNGGGLEPGPRGEYLEVVDVRLCMVHVGCHSALLRLAQGS